MSERTVQRLEDTPENRSLILEMARKATVENPMWAYSHRWTQYPGMHSGQRVLCSCTLSGHTSMKSPKPEQVLRNIEEHFENDAPLSEGEYFEVIS